MSACACGCPDPAAPRSKYAHGERCRKRAYRQKLEREARAAGQETRLSLEKVRTMVRVIHGDGARTGDAQRPARKPREGVSVYFPTPEAFEAAYEWAAWVEWVPPDGQPAHRAAEDAMKRARERLAAKRARE